MMHYRPERLPQPLTFYQREGVLTGTRRQRKSRNWHYGRCPFHATKSGASFAVNIQNGSFHCFGCGKHGDMPRYVMERDRVDFKTACMTLGAWDDARTPAAQIEAQRAQAQRECKRAGEAERRQTITELRRSACSEVQRHNRMLATASKQLDAATTEQDSEDAWAAMAASQDGLNFWLPVLDELERLEDQAGGIYRG